ncbi:MAG: GAF domain-containing sensor histidine kinase [Acidimicrobiia bacterium]|nr:GAF domain-containing sensor histidine kinase [Acidimicrobiia bacterium]
MPAVDPPLSAIDSAQESLAQRHRDALAVCARVLLFADDLEQVDEALQALLAATDATSIFIELNVEDPDLGACSSMVREVTQPGYNSDPDHWSLVPWDNMPDSYQHLSQGKPFAFLVSGLGPTERAQYEGVTSLSELDVPFSMNDEWVGLIGLSDHRVERAWRNDEVGLMVTAAEMVGAFWERRETRRVAEQMVATTQQALRYQQALVASARALLSVADEKKVLAATLEALTEATNIDYGFVERNVEVPGVGLCSETVFEFDRNDLEGEIDLYWQQVPWSNMPDSYKRLSRGLPFAFTPDDLGPIERSLYENDPYPVQSEVDIPIFVDGSWEGLVGFADTRRVREWTPEELDLLTTIAELIGAHWARQNTEERLGRLLKAKDAFLASVSHELRTPLTVVVGLAAELDQDPQRFEPETTREFIEIIAQQSTDLANIVDDLLVAARVDSDIQVSPSRMDLGIEVTSVVEALGMDGLEVTGTAVAWADAARVRQVVRNLLTNAVRYGGRNVEIEISSVQDLAIVRVIDDGEGVGAGLIDTLFEPYQIGHREQSQPDAIGLGLFISRRLATLMGGDLRYSREAGRTVFSLAIPHHRSTTQQAA